MIPIETLVDAYINLHIVLAVAGLVWLILRAGLIRIAGNPAYATRQRLVQGALLAVLLSPLLGAGIGTVQSWAAPESSLRLADVALTQFLHGNLEMSAAQFETAMSLRTRITSQFVALASPFAAAIAAALAIGVGVHLIGLLGSMAQLQSLIGTSFLWRRAGRVDIRLSDRIAIPFSTRGFFRRHILLPSPMLDQPKELRIALAHELQHMRQGDVEWEMALALLRPFLFWNPTFRAWAQEIETLREVTCDQNVMARGRVAPAAYADCLLQVAERARRMQMAYVQVTPRVPLLAASPNAASILRARVLAVLDAPRPGAKRLWIGLALTITVVIGLTQAALQKPNDWSQDRLMLATIVNLERLEARNTLATPPIW